MFQFRKRTQTNLIDVWKASNNRIGSIGTIDRDEFFWYYSKTKHRRNLCSCSYVLVLPLIRLERFLTSRSEFERKVDRSSFHAAHYSYLIDWIDTRILWASITRWIDQLIKSWMINSIFKCVLFLIFLSKRSEIHRWKNNLICSGISLSHRYCWSSWWIHWCMNNFRFSPYFCFLSDKSNVTSIHEDEWEVNSFTKTPSENSFRVFHFELPQFSRYKTQIKAPLMKWWNKRSFAQSSRPQKSSIQRSTLIRYWTRILLESFSLDIHN